MLLIFGLPRRGLEERVPNDMRIRQKVYSKYGILEDNRVRPLLHIVSKQIVEIAKARQYGVSWRGSLESHGSTGRGTIKPENTEHG